MKKLKPLRFPIITLSIFVQSACSYSASGDKNEPSVHKPANSISCPEVSELVTIIGNKKIFEQNPEEFFTSTTTLIKPTSDKTTQATSQADRNIDFVQTQNDWLTSAHSAYGIHSKNIFFEQAIFQFSPSCFKTPADFINITKLKIGKGYKDLTFPPPDDAVKVLKWSWQDPDINKMRLVQVIASNELYEIKVIIDPAPTAP